MNKRPATDFVYATATGDRGGIGFFPLNAVRWLTPPRDIAAIVTETGSLSLSAKLFHFGKSAREMGAEFYLLEPGDYTMVLRPADDNTKKAVEKTLQVKGQSSKVRFTLPPREVFELTVGAKK